MLEPLLSLLCQTKLIRVAPMISDAPPTSSTPLSFTLQNHCRIETVNYSELHCEYSWYKGLGGKHEDRRRWKERLDTGEVMDTLDGTCQNLKCNFRSLGSSTGPVSFQMFISKVGRLEMYVMIKENRTNESKSVKFLLK